MEVYADALAQGLHDLKIGDLELTQFRPQSRFASAAANSWSMRVARYWDYPRQIKQTPADVYHIIDHGYAHLTRALPGRGRVITVHDLIPILRWKGKIEGAMPNGKPWLSLYSMKRLAQADRIIAVSHNTKADIQTHIGIPEKDICVIYPGVDPGFRPIAEERIASFKHTMGWESNGGTKHILITGDQFYKNHRAALEIFKRVKERCDFPVKLVNSNSHKRSVSLSAATDECGMSATDIREICIHPHMKMPFLLNSVDCLLFPSLYEGFGMPVIEALACGTPVVCSNRGALPEVAKGMASIHDARDVDGMADSVCDILYSAQRRNAGGLHDEVCNRFSWREAARRTYEEYHRAGGSA